MRKRAALTDEELEILRIKARNRLYTILTLTGILFMVILIGFSWSIYNDGRMDGILECIGTGLLAAVMCSILFFYILAAVAGGAGERFGNAFKERYVLEAIKSTGVFEEPFYDRKSGFSYQEIYAAAVVDCGLKRCFLSEDKVTGRYRGNYFVCSDVHTGKLVKRGRSLEVKTIFNGQVLCFADFDERKTCSGYLQIFQKEFLSDIKGRIAEHKIETESAVFNDKFDVYAIDEHNAYYILTPLLMEKIEKFSVRAGAQIAISFHGRAMYVAINRKLSMFDPLLDKPVAVQKQDIVDDLKIIQDAGDILLCG